MQNELANVFYIQYGHKIKTHLLFLITFVMLIFNNMNIHKKNFSIIKGLILNNLYLVQTYVNVIFIPLN